MLELLIEDGMMSSASLLQPEAEQGRVQMVCHLKGVASKHVERNHKCLPLSHYIEEGTLQQLLYLLLTEWLSTGVLQQTIRNFNFS